MKIQRLLQRLVPMALVFMVLETMSLACLVLTYLALACVPAFAEDVPEALRPPKGATIAIVVSKTCNARNAAESRPAGAGFKNL